MSDQRNINTLTVLRIGLLLLGVAACVYLVNTNLPALKTLLQEGTLTVWPHLYVALAMFILHVVLVFYAWHFSLGLVGIDVSLRSSALIFLVSLVTRYIPGGVWHLGSRLLAMSRLGKNPYLVSVTLFLEQMAALAVCMLLAMLFVSVSTVLFPDFGSVNLNTFGTKEWFFVLVGIGLLVILYPPVFKGLLTRAFVFLKGKKLSAPLASSGLFQLYGIHVLSLLIFAVGYEQVLATVAGYVLPPAAIVVAVVLVATLLGFLAPFIPGGIGVRESLIVVLLAPFTSTAEATAMAIASRILIIVVEFFMLFLMIFMHGRMSGD